MLVVPDRRRCYGPYSLSPGDARRAIPSTATIKESSGGPRTRCDGCRQVASPGHRAVETFRVEDAMTSQTRLRSDESSPLADAARNVADQAGQAVEAQASTAMDQIAHTVEQVAQAVRRAGEELRQDQPQIASIAPTSSRITAKTSPARIVT